MTQATGDKRFFVEAGTLPPDSPSYIPRSADERLYRHASEGHFCYVLSARQMGKSSLMIRTIQRLKDDGVKTASIDLSLFGTDVTSEQWYLGFLNELARQLRLATDPPAWWAARQSLGPVQRFTDFLHGVVLAEIEAPVVIFVDEIDYTLRLDFSDDFFAAIRAVYNQRASEPAYHRLTFVLLGVATPSELIKDSRRTPFNIGQAIEVNEFTLDELEPFASRLDQAYAGRGHEALQRIYHWTNGHPYLTQRLCAYTVDNPDPGQAVGSQVDTAVRQLFLDEEATARELNLKFIRDRINSSANTLSLVDLYRQVYKGRKIPEDRRSSEQVYLKLFGLLGPGNGYLRVRNHIYREAFDSEWISTYYPVSWRRRLAVVAAVLFLILFGLTAWEAAAPVGPFTAAIAEVRLVQSANPSDLETQYHAFEYLFGLDSSRYHELAHSTFAGLSATNQLEFINLALERSRPDLALAGFRSLEYEAQFAILSQLVEESPRSLKKLIALALPEQPDSADGNQLLIDMFHLLEQLDGTDAEALTLKAEIVGLLEQRDAMP